MTETAQGGLLVVGSGPAGLSAARAFRDHAGKGPVRVVTHDHHPPYNRPPLSKDFLRGEIEEDALALEAPSFYRDRGIELVLGRRAVDLRPSSNEVVLDGGDRLAYDACVVATGSKPSVLPAPGADQPGVLLLRSREQAATLRRAVEGVGSVVVVGSGFIGCEAAASLALRGLDVTVVSVEERPQEARLGADVARHIAGWLAGQGVRLVGGRSVESVVDGRVVHVDDGSSYRADVVVMAAGVSPQGGLAERAGLAMSAGRVLVDARMRTGTPGVLAAGDVALAHNAAAGRRIAVEHWGDALRMGEIAGGNAAGGTDGWAQAPGFWSEIGDHTLKYAAWGDGYDEVRVVEYGDGAFTAWYGRDGLVVGVLAHEADEDYERGQRLVEDGAPYDEVATG